MLGELIGEDQGKITGIRVLPCEGHNPKVEVSMQASGRLLGVECSELGTYESTLTDAGVFRGSGQGVVMTQDGETVYWTGEGVGKPGGKGLAASWRGAIYYRTNSQRLAKLNSVVAVFEHEVDEAGNLKSKIFEWK